MVRFDESNNSLVGLTVSGNLEMAIRARGRIFVKDAD